LFKKTEDGIIPCTIYGCHEIKTADAAPVRKQYHRVPCVLREEMRGQIGEMKAGRIILRWIFWMWGQGLDRSGSGQGQMVGCCECGYERLGSIK